MRLMKLYHWIKFKFARKRYYRPKQLCEECALPATKWFIEDGVKWYACNTCFPFMVEG